MRSRLSLPGSADEILTLRIITLTDEEKDEMRRSDDRTRQLLERTAGRCV